MKRYDNRVLNKLLDSYENSSAYSAYRPGCGNAAVDSEQKHKRGIFCRLDQKNFPEYYDTTSGAYETVHDQLMELEQKGLIRLYWRNGVKGHILEKAALEVCSAERCYEYLGRTPRWKKEERIAEISSKYRTLSDEGHAGISSTDSSGIMLSFLDWVENRLTNGESIKRYVDIGDPSGFDRLCRLLTAILTNDQDKYLRQLSTEVFNDSKIAERELEKAVSVIRGFKDSAYAADDYSVMNSDEILESLGVYRNPVWMYIKGYAAMMIEPESGGSGDRVWLQSLENGIGFTLRDLSRIRPDPTNPPDCVMTVENLTSYYQQEPLLSGMKTMIVYLGGFAGRQKLAFLKRLRDAYPRARFLHSGDIDCGGFRIWKSLCCGTGISFETYNMDVETFKKHIRTGRPLTDPDRKHLEKMIDDPFFAKQKDIFDLMLLTGIKLEQESFV